MGGSQICHCSCLLQIVIRVVLYYVRDLTARSFASFINYLRTLVRVRCKSELKGLYGDYFSTFLDRSSIAVLRAQLGVEFESVPPYLHQRNPYAEGIIRIIKIGTRARLGKLVGKVINGEIIRDAAVYFNFAMEHKAQSLNSTPSTTLERDLGVLATRNQCFVSGNDPMLLEPEETKLHPFARNPPKKPQRSPRAGGAENANDGKAPGFPKTEPTSTRAAHPARNRPKIAPDERGASSS